MIIFVFYVDIHIFLNWRMEILFVLKKSVETKKKLLIKQYNLKKRIEEHTLSNVKIFVSKIKEITFYLHQIFLLMNLISKM